MNLALLSHSDLLLFCVYDVTIGSLLLTDKIVCFNGDAAAASVLVLSHHYVLVLSLIHI